MKCKYGCFKYADGAKMTLIAQFCPKHDKTKYDTKALLKLLLKRVFVS